jgi:serine/threonine protein kinase
VGKVGYRGEPVDVWSAGCVLFAFVCGHLPFQAGAQRLAPQMEWPAVIQGSLRDLLSSMLLHNPRERVALRGVATSAWLRAAHEPHLNAPRPSHVRSHSQTHSSRQAVSQHAVPWARPAARVQVVDADASCCQAG